MTTHHHEFDAPGERHDGFAGRSSGRSGLRFPGRFGGPFGGPGMGPRGFGPGFGFGPGPGFGQGGPRARRGDVRNAILGLLAEAPANGYGLIKAIGEKTDGAWTPSPGSVYPTLAQLVDEGLIVQNDGPRGAYSLTDSGRAYVQEHSTEIASALSGPGERGAGGGELFASVGKLMGVVGQFRFGVSADQRDRAVKRIDDLRRELHTILAE